MERRRNGLAFERGHRLIDDELFSNPLGGASVGRFFVDVGAAIDGRAPAASEVDSLVDDLRGDAHRAGPAEPSPDAMMAQVFG